MASVGVHVILDDVFWERDVLELANRAMAGIPHLVVEVNCDVAVASEREARRTDWYSGGVAAYASEPPLVAEPAVTLDTSCRTASECASELVGLVRYLQRHISTGGDLDHPGQISGPVPIRRSPPAQ